MIHSAVSLERFLSTHSDFGLGNQPVLDLHKSTYRKIAEERHMIFEQPGKYLFHAFHEPSLSLIFRLITGSLRDCGQLAD